MKRTAVTEFALVMILYACVCSDAVAQVKGRVVEYHKDGTGNGYCVVIVSGTYYEMGYAQGYLLAHDILANVQLMKNFAALAGKSWASARTLCNTTAFLPQDTLDEFNGLADGVRAAVSTSTLDVVDFQTIALAGDWLNMTFCRTHSCWGSFVQAPVKTLTTRRADAPYSLAPIPFFFWEMIAYIPSGSGKTQWVNITSPGVTSGNTCVNEYGSVVASHDYNTSGSVNTGPNLISRHAVCRYLIAADMPSHDIATHLDYLYNSLRSPIPYRSLINGFANCFVPEGCRGVMELNKTITPGITNLRKPRPEFYAGEVIVCANSFTDGTSMPTGAEFLTAYYNGTKPKTLQDHWDVTFENKTDNVVQMSVAYRNRGDMTIWWNGYLKNARTGTIKREWADLFGSTGTPPANTSPSVTLTTPVTGSTYTAPATMNLAATATDPDGTIAAVRFYSGMTLLNLDTVSPYNLHVDRCVQRDVSAVRHGDGQPGGGEHLRGGERDGIPAQPTAYGHDDQPGQQQHLHRAGGDRTCSDGERPGRQYCKCPVLPWHHSAHYRQCESV